MPRAHDLPKGIPHLSGKVVVVTGAALGIGRALSSALLAKGCHLALVDLDEETLSSLHDALSRAAPHRRVTMHAADVADRARMRALADEVVQAHGAVDVLVNNAGVAYEAPFPQTILDDWDRVIAVNLMGVIHGCHFFLPHLAKVERAHIVNLSSLLGVIAMPGQAAYSATKFAVRGLSEALQEELRETTVGLTVVHPGAVATGMMTRARCDDPDLVQRIDAWYERNAASPERVAARIVRAIEKGKPRLVVAPDAVFGDLLKRLMPVAGNRLLVDLAIRMLGLEYMRAKRGKQWQETMVDGNVVDLQHETSRDGR
jgi:short-subunit dehydrogenase